MNRNTQERFALNPVNIDIQRSRFLMTPNVKTTFNLGDIVPLGKPIEILPGDSFEISTAMAIRMMPMVTSPFDNLTASLYFFYIPNRLLWNHWKEFMGENTESAWIPETEYTVPQVSLEQGARPGTVADYMTVPTDIGENKWIDVNAMYFRGYAMIYNEWFRNQNVIPPVMVHTDDTDRALRRTGTDYLDPVISAELGGPLLKASKRPDMFVKALPGPQKGIDLTIMDHMPVYVDPDAIRDASAVHAAHNVANLVYTVPSNNDANLTYGVANRSMKFDTTAGSPYNNVQLAQPNNFYVDGNLTISALRTAFQIQKLYEKDARGGTRYREILKSHFGVTSPDASQQVPQYLGGRDIPIKINSVVQTSESGNTPQGNIAGYSITGDAKNSPDVKMSFTEHGLLYPLLVVRIDQHSYQNGLHRSFSRKNRFDYYFPTLANISEFPVYNEEIFCTGYTVGDLNEEEHTYTTDKEVFGYQEAWYDYRFAPSALTGLMRSNVSNSLDVWHFGDDYDSLPRLSQSWIEEDKTNIDRVLAVTSEVNNQFFGDFEFYIKATRPMPMYSIPGLVDHH